MDLCVEWACLWADHHPTYVCKMEVKKVAVLLCQEWQTSPGWSLKALEELLPIGELIRFDSLLPPLFWHIFTLLLMFPVFMNLALLLHFPVCVFFLPDVVSLAISVTLCVLQNWKKKKKASGKTPHWNDSTFSMRVSHAGWNMFDWYIKHLSKILLYKGLNYCIHSGYELAFWKSKGSFKIAMICWQWWIWYLFSSWTCLDTGFLDTGSLVL